MLRFLIIILAIPRIMGVPSVPSSSEHSQDTLRRTKAEEMLNYMNQSVNPCDDFYKFACGNYHNHLHGGIQASSLKDIMDISKDEKITKALETDDATDTAADKQMKSFYRSCIAAATNPPATYKHKFANLIREYGKMPLLEGENWSEVDFDWLETIAKIAHNTNIGIILLIVTPADYHNNAINRAYLTQALMRDRSFYLKESAKSHNKYIDEVATDLNTFLDVDRALASQAAKEMLEFETGLAQGAHDGQKDMTKSELFPVSSIDDLQRKYWPVWNFKKMLNLTLGVLPDLVNVQDTYVKNTMEVLKTTPKRVLANYIFYVLINQFTDPWKASETYPLNTSCVETTNSHFYKLLNNMIYRKFYNEQSKEVISSVWQQLKATFIENLQTPGFSWIHEVTLKLAVEKLKKVTLTFGTYEDTDFDQKAKQLAINDHDYIENMKSVFALSGRHTRERLNQPPKKDDFLESLSFSPAYYARFNYIAIPVSFLAPNLVWSSSLPHAYTFAKIGFIIAHEIIHALDDDGRHMDAKGNDSDWWDSDSINEFEDRKKCFIEQYHHYTVNDVSVPEMKAQAENIADNGGLRLAYETYLKWYGNTAKIERQMELMTGLNYTNNQLFFINYAQFWCSMQEADDVADQLISDTHVPDTLRVVVPLSNLEEFSKEFNCPKGSRMNPEAKCKIF